MNNIDIKNVVVKEWFFYKAFKGCIPHKHLANADNRKVGELLVRPYYCGVHTDKAIQIVCVNYGKLENNWLALSVLENDINNIKINTEQEIQDEIDNQASYM